MGPVVYYIILAIITAIVVILAYRTCLLNDVVINTIAFQAKAVSSKIEKPNAPFSLAKTQLAFWTIIIFSSFLYILLKYGECPAINSVNLTLLGIAVTTTAAGKVIDNSQKNNGDLNQDHPSEGFITDILSDKQGVSIHRLQNVLWTLVVGFMYIRYVATDFNLPDEEVITNNLLLLMGISNTAYLGLKTAENTKPSSASNNVNTNTANNNNQEATT